MSGYVEVAKEIAARNNVARIGMCVGEVTGYEPVTIRTYYHGVPLDHTEFYSIKGLMNEGTDTTTGDLYLEEYPYEIGDKYICMYAEDNQSIYILGKFEGIDNLNIYLTKGE